MLCVNQEDCLIDEKIHVKICSLKPHQRTTLRCETIEKNYVYDSYAHYIADYNGEVDLSLSPSFGGSYKGIDEMGIFWSILPAKGQMKGLQYVPQCPMEPCLFKLQVYDGFVSDEEFVKKNIKTKVQKKYPIAEKVIQRRFAANNVIREEISHGNVRGVLFKPNGPGPFKGIIDMYGGSGGLMEKRAPLFASHGYASMVLPLFNYKDLPKTWHGFHLDYVMEGVNYLASRPDILPGVSLVGICLGALTAAQLASENSNISSVVLINAGFLPVPLKLHGISTPPLEEFSQHVFLKYLGVDKRGAEIMCGSFEERDIIPESFSIKMEKSVARFLIIIGENDLMFDPKLNALRYKERLEKKGKGDRVSFISYPGTGHIIEPPYLPQTLCCFTSTFNLLSATGGEEIEHAMACIHVWKEILQFLNIHTGKMSYVSKL